MKSKYRLQSKTERMFIECHTYRLDLLFSVKQAHIHTELLSVIVLR